MKLDGDVLIPKELKDLVPEAPKTVGFPLDKIPRKVDIVLLCALYGLYISKELPPMVNPTQYIIDSEGIEMENRRFNVIIKNTINQFRHLLLMLWVTKEQTKLSDSMEYRTKLYGFLEKLLNPLYIRRVLIPFYVLKAAKKIQGEPSFISKLRNVNSVGYETSVFAPEQIFIEFFTLNRDFEDFISTEMKEWQNSLQNGVK